MSAPPVQGVNNLTTLIKRLEAATSRLEDLASSPGPPNVSETTENAAPEFADTVTSSLAAQPAQETSQNGEPHATRPTAPELPPIVTAMDKILDKQVETFVATSEGIDSLMKEQTLSVVQAFADHRRFLLLTTKAEMPNVETLKKLVDDQRRSIKSIETIRSEHQGSELDNHLASLAGGINALDWHSYTKQEKPADWIQAMIDSSKYYSDKIPKASNKAEPNYSQYFQSFRDLLKPYLECIETNYPDTLTWNEEGMDALQAYHELDPTYSSRDGVPSAPSPSGVPPPPPPPPLHTFDNVPAPPLPPSGAAPKPVAVGNMGTVFDQLNRGEAVTSRLKKVDSSQMTHKNPSLRAGSIVPGARSKSPGPNVKPKPASMRQNSMPVTPSTREGKKELVDKETRWIIEDWDAPGLLPIDVKPDQSLLISNCKNTLIKLEGKAKVISIDNCPRLQIDVDDVISSIDVIRSPNLALTAMGAVPIIFLDQVDVASLSFGPSSYACEVFTNKCSAVNIVLRAADKGKCDSVECPVPTQLRSYIKDGKVVSEIVEHDG